MLAGKNRPLLSTRFQDLEIGWFDGDGKLLEVAPLRANDAQVVLQTFTRVHVSSQVAVRFFRERGKPTVLGTRGAF